MKVFRDSNGRIYQLADEKKMDEWDAEMPIIFIGYVRDNLIPSYPKSLKKEVSEYMDHLLEKIAIPKLLEALNSDNEEERIKVSSNIKEISKNNPDQLKIAMNAISNALSDKNKEVKDNLKEALNNYKKAQKRKETIKKRKKLKELRDKMDEIDNEFAEGKISDQEYLEKQKEYLNLKREIELEERID